MCVYIYIPIYYQKGTLGALGFCIFCFFMFFSLFHFHLSICPKSQGKPKRNKKNNPVRRIWSKSIPDCFFCSFGFPRFSRGFWVSQAPTVQKLKENQKKTKKTILSHSGLFFLFFLVYLVFLEVFAVPSPTVQKLEENQKNQKNQSCEKNLG